MVLVILGTLYEAVLLWRFKRSPKVDEPSTGKPNYIYMKIFETTIVIGLQVKLRVQRGTESPLSLTLRVISGFYKVKEQFNAWRVLSWPCIVHMMSSARQTTCSSR